MAHGSELWSKFPDAIHAYINTDILLYRLMGTLCFKAAKFDETTGQLRLKKGQLITSHRGLAEELGTVRSQIERKLKLLEKKELITIKSERNVGTLITVCCMALPESGALMGHEKKKSGARNGARKPIKKQEVKPIHGSPNGAPLGHHVGEKWGFLLDIDKEKRGGEGEAAVPPTPPPLENDKNENEIGNGDPLREEVSIKPGHVVLNEVNALALEWYGRIIEFNPQAHLNEFDISDDLEEIMSRGWTLEKLSLVLTFLQNGAHKICGEFISPSQFEQNFFGQTYIEAAFAQAKVWQTKNTPPKDKYLLDEAVNSKLRDNCLKTKDDPMFLAELAKLAEERRQKGNSSLRLVDRLKG